MQRSLSKGAVYSSRKIQLELKMLALYVRLGSLPALHCIFVTFLMEERKMYSKSVRTIINEYYTTELVSMDVPLLTSLIWHAQEIPSENEMRMFIKAIRKVSEHYRKPLTLDCYEDILAKTVELYNMAWPESPISLPEVSEIPSPAMPEVVAESEEA